MGSMIVESSMAEEIFVENGVKDNKKKKRRSRRSKQNCSLSACISVNEICTDELRLPGGCSSSEHVVSSVHHQQQKELNVDFSSIPEAHLNKQIADENLKSQLNGNIEVVCSNLGPDPGVSEEVSGPVLIAREVVCQARRKYYPAHWSAEAVSKALEEGRLFTAIFHVNAHNSLEAYCKIDGVQTDVLISGMVAQNRAIEGDTVAIVIDPPSSWPQMKGSFGTPSNPNCLQLHEALVHGLDSSRGNSELQVVSDNASSSNNPIILEDGANHENRLACVSSSDKSYGDGLLENGCINGCPVDAYETVNTLEKLCTLACLLPSKRPTGSVVTVMERSVRRDKVVGYLSMRHWNYSRENRRKDWKTRKNKHQSDVNDGYIMLVPNDPRLTKMMVRVKNLPGSIQKRLEAGDLTVETDQVAAKVVDWAEESYIPEACVIRIFGRGSDVETQIAAILFEHAIDVSEFSPEVLSCIPHIPWEVPQEELQNRRDLRNLCIFTIDPATATDLDDALSVEKLPSGVFRVGVHIADASYFVLPDTALDFDAQIRSTSVYLLQRKLPMLPPMLSDNLASLNPGMDRLAFSIFWDINSEGEILDRWIGRTIIWSCCKLSYEHAQEIIDGTFDAKNSSSMGNISQWPNLYGQFGWFDVIKSVKSLHQVSNKLKENRFKSGALSLESPKLGFLFDEDGLPDDSVLTGRKDSNFLVEELMLLANKTAAEVITRAYPSRALLRRHPEPNARKLQEFEAFCSKHGLKLDTSSSTQLHYSLEHIREELKNDPGLFDIVLSYATRPMQLATYFCTGDPKNANSDWCHYALAVPLYTHFTSPLRRYPDIVVHRTLAAALEAEDIYRKGCFTGLRLCKDDIVSVEAQEALSVAASKNGVICPENLTVLAAHCNDKKIASRRVKDATDRLYMWALLKKKWILYSEARVLGLGPKFMSIYIPKLAIERRIYYGEVEGLKVEWLDATSTLLLSQSMLKLPNRRNSPGKFRSVEEIALIVSPTDLELEKNLSGLSAEEDGESLGCEGISDISNNGPSVFPLTVHLLSSIPVALHAIGGDDGPLDIVARLYISSYFQ